MRPLPLAMMAGAAAALFAIPAFAADERAGSAQVERLVARLGSPNYADREEASRALKATGAPALDALRKAVGSSDAEIARRAQELVVVLEVQADSQRLLQTTRLRLTYKDTPLKDAIVDFNKKAAIKLGLEEDLANEQGVRLWDEANRPGSRPRPISPPGKTGNAEGEQPKSASQVQLESTKITLDTGEVSFWEAYDQFCRAAGLVDRALVPTTTRPLGMGNLTDPSGLIQARRRALIVQDSLGLANGGWNQPHDGNFSVVFATLAPLPTCYAGRVRVRVHPPGVPVSGPLTGEGEKLLGLEVMPQPGLAWQGILNVRITRALDEGGREVRETFPYVGDPSGLGNDQLADVLVWDDGQGFVQGTDCVPWQVPLRLRLAREQMKRLKELSGVVAAQVRLLNEPLLVQDDVLHAAGTTITGAGGGSLQVLDVRREKDGRVRVKVDLHPPQAGDGQNGDIVMRRGGRGRFIQRRRLIVAGGEVVTNPEFQGLILEDNAGKPYRPAEVEGLADVSRPGDVGTWVVFRPQAGQAEPARLVFQGPRDVVLEIPFTLKDVPLP